ncbi:sulfite exporter TauE/SafE family protein [Leptolyngbya sp. FACHB-36]|uniref:nickel/cobalt transporter n=1 Tax=Leptolyngbya sp. FACHB-36 TaxID=2692808 RepID=UPI0016811C19|nr:sulfite exporter TauE/SafE family protein [Leptolyngbya sp. FACHB-36]MBD2022152.1 sulfite exporter TauE/SafE family protein [Leptolyngbya sp. FACHB-36]
MSSHPWIAAFCRSFAVWFVVLAAWLGCTPIASAHPLGNFTINHFSHVTVDRTHVTVQYVVDMAEIPAFQALQTIDTDGNGASAAELNTYLEQAIARYQTGLRLTIDDRTVPLHAGARKVTLPPGAGGLPTLRVEGEFSGAVPLGATHRLRFEETNDRPRLGWREIVVTAGAGVQIFNSSAYSNSLTNELRAYPQDLLTMPLQESIADLSSTQGEIPAGATPLQTRQGQVTSRARDPFADLIAVPQITLPIALVSLVVAAGLGSVHALSPGHGKAIVGAYLIGAQATVRHAAFLGLTVTITHTIGVFVLGLLTLLASRYVLPERLFPYLSLVSGGMISLLGLRLLIYRFLTVFAPATRQQSHSHHHHSHSHDHSDDHSLEHCHDGHWHSHEPPSTVTWKSLLALGISGGLLPCPSALIVFLSAVSLHRVGFGLLLVFAFSLGLAGTLTCVGLLFIHARRSIEQFRGSSQWLPALSIPSAAVITGLGAVLCYQALLALGGLIGTI